MKIIVSTYFCVCHNTSIFQSVCVAYKLWIALDAIGDYNSRKQVSNKQTEMTQHCYVFGNLL